ncbi:MAG: hypothetical protein LBO74_08115 [Candidatus Symbiothrix sp.]|jgi:hypothetical protein|nr:hypothetical protein [Candidatus Symbiothrix sp.]
MKLLLLDGMNNISAITTFNRKYSIDENFLLLASILKSNQLELDYIDFANDRVEHLQIPKDELYSFVIINTNRNNIHIVYFSYKLKDVDIQDYSPIISTKVYFDNLNNTHILTDADFYMDKTVRFRSGFR